MLDSRSSPKSKPELWGGMECTINRIGDKYHDQLLTGGYYDHPRMLDLIPTLNVKAFRYPILWERHERVQGQNIDWTFAAAGLKKLKAAGIKPIVGLLHHGSGPAYTDLLDETFSVKFQDYARKVAKAFPDTQYYTPINEPLTTARFSGLYGFWYPHNKEPLCFARMLINQLKGVVLAMQAIRSVNPSAKLVQTEDLAKTHSTGLLKYQAEFENARRWLSFDLLCGKVDLEHDMWHYLVSVGIRETELDFFLKNPCSPDILGLNYYVTSERFLDHRCDLYPDEISGGNGIDRYVDIAACRSTVPIDLDALLAEAWSRYRIPMAITEAHIACTREEQLRWFREIWDSACRAVDNDIDLRAVTVWSVFGAYDWDSLVTARNDHYESGAFDIKNYLRPTVLAAMIKTLANGKDYHHPLLNQNGWWRSPPHELSGRPLLLVSQSGSFTAGLLRVCEHRRIQIVELSGDNTDLEDSAKILSKVSKINAWGIIDAFDTGDEGDERTDEVYAAIVSQNLVAVSTLKDIPYMLFSKRVSAKTSESEDASHLLHLLNRALDLFIDIESGTWTDAHGSLSRDETVTNTARFEDLSQDKLVHIKGHGDFKVHTAGTMGHSRSVESPDLCEAIDEYLIQFNF